MTNERQNGAERRDEAAPAVAEPEAGFEPDELERARAEVRQRFVGVRGSLRAWLFLSAALATAILDQLTKWLVFSHVPRGPQSLEIVPGQLWLCHVYNKGVAWGMLSQHPEIVSIVAVTTAVFVLLCGLWGRFGWRTYVVGLGLVFGGAVGNLVDRTFRSEGVLDFIDVGWWPQFNVADIGVVVGAVLVGLMILRATAIEERAVREALRALDAAEEARRASE